MACSVYAGPPRPRNPSQSPENAPLVTSIEHEYGTEPPAVERTPLKVMMFPVCVAEVIV